MLRHTMQEEDWCAIAKVLVVGYLQEQYLPIFLAVPFMENCLFDRYNEASLLETFMQFVDDDERDTLERCLNNLDDVPPEECDEVLCTYEVKVKVSKANIKKVLDEVAHKYIIQMPAFVSRCWAPLLRKYVVPKLPMQNLQAFGERLKPTTRKVVSMLSFTQDVELNRRYKSLSEMVKKYVCSLDEEKLGAFLRFCTGKVVIEI